MNKDTELSICKAVFLFKPNNVQNISKIFQVVSERLPFKYFYANFPESQCNNQKISDNKTKHFVYNQLLSDKKAMQKGEVARP